MSGERPKYLSDVARKLAALNAVGLTPPGLYMIEVKHDEWCNLLDGSGPCNCNPEVCSPRPYRPVTN